MVDPVTCWVELAQLYIYRPLTAYKCQQLLDSIWLSRYPRPEEIGIEWIMVANLKQNLANCART